VALVWIIVGVVIGAIARAIVRGLIVVIREERATEKERRLAEAPDAYAEGRRKVLSWMPDCAHILASEGNDGNAYRSGSSCFRARSKSLDLIEGALEHATLLDEEDITRASFTAVKQLTNWQGCCTDCKESNEGKSNPQCLALAEATDIEVELRFALVDNEDD